MVYNFQGYKDEIKFFFRWKMIEKSDEYFYYDITQKRSNLNQWLEYNV